MVGSEIRFETLLPGGLAMAASTVGSAAAILRLGPPSDDEQIAHA